MVCSMNLACRRYLGVDMGICFHPLLPLLDYEFLELKFYTGEIILGVDIQ